MNFSQLGSVIFSIILPSIPEQIFITFFTLFLLGKSKEIKIKSENMTKLIICSVSGASISVLLRVYVPYLVETGILLPVGVLISWLLVVLVYRIFAFKEMIRALICSAISLILIVIFQMAYVPLLLSGTKMGLEEVTKPGITSFIWSLPELVIMFSIISIISVKKHMQYNVNFLTIITRNKVVMIVTISLLFFNLIFLAIMVKLIGFDKILMNIEFINQLLIIIIIVIFPILNISLLMVTLYSNYYRETMRVLLSKDRISTLVNILKIYSEDNNFTKIDNIVDDLCKQVNSL